MINSQWSTKRVFYATPQTLLNALINGHVEALDIVLLVIGMSYATVARIPVDFDSLTILQMRRIEGQGIMRMHKSSVT